MLGAADVVSAAVVSLLSEAAVVSFESEESDEDELSFDDELEEPESDEPWPPLQ